eukprot:CAMPEP_0114678590 /NCGR_PEP_ID=MMETSP0191-20121206/51949_1 /TAXON_ID=126664 /ORGANISM="Sorites sp." /LENGTH=31 /DNA_ID= /DNA_START= /DNA_END= /DNA_ORIENTATION=
MWYGINASCGVNAFTLKRLHRKSGVGEKMGA